MPLREVCWDTGGEQDFIRVPAAGSVDAGKPHAVAQLAPGHPAALSSRGTHPLPPYNVICHPLSPSFIHPTPTFHLLVEQALGLSRRDSGRKPPRQLPALRSTHSYWKAALKIKIAVVKTVVRAVKPQ